MHSLEFLGTQFYERKHALKNVTIFLKLGIIWVIIEKRCRNKFICKKKKVFKNEIDLKYNSERVLLWQQLKTWGTRK